jgi:hypothetical protein
LDFRQTYLIQFFSNPAGNEGKTFIGEKEVLANEKGKASFIFHPDMPLAAGEKITATATWDQNPSTSEFSAPVGVSSG